MTKNADTKFGSLSWVEITTDSIDSPSSRSGHSLIYFEGSLYLFGGKDDYSASNELWQYHIEARVWTKLTCFGPNPPRLFNHMAVLYDRKIFVFGGSCSSNFSLWVFDFDVYEWSVYHGNETWPKNRHSQSVALLNNHVYMYGGYTFLGRECDELWCYDLDENEWKEVKVTSDCKPNAMFGHTAVFNGPIMWLFGGSYLREVQHSLWALDTESWAWKHVSRPFSPPGLYYHIALVTGDIMLVYGGMDESIQPYTGMWRFNFETEEWTQMVSTELPPLSGHAVAVSYVKSVQTEQRTAGYIQFPDKTQQTVLDNKALEEQVAERKSSCHAVVEMFPVTPGDIELRPFTTQSTFSKSSADSHYSLPGMVEDSEGYSHVTSTEHAAHHAAHHDPSCGSPPQRLHHAVYENKTVTQLQQPAFCVNNPLYNDNITFDDTANGTTQHTAQNTNGVQNRITFYDKSVLNDNKLEHSDSGSQGSRSSMKKKTFKRGCKTEFFIVGHGQEPLPLSSVLYRCKIV